MKTSTLLFCILLSIISLFQISILHSQTTTQPLSGDANAKNLYEKAKLNNLNSSTQNLDKLYGIAGLRLKDFEDFDFKGALDSDDLLRATRKDKWEENWIFIDSIEYYYDSDNNITLRLHKNWDGSNWVNSGKQIYEFNSNNNLTLDLYQNWKESSWVNSSQRFYGYDSNNNRTLLLWQNWEEDSWVNYENRISEYDSHNNITLSLYQNWEESSWVNFKQSIYEYDSNNNRTLLLWQNWEEGSWVNYEKRISEYDSHNNRTLSLYQNWEESSWVNFKQLIYEYNSNNNLALRLNQNWEENSWVNWSQFIYEYDSNNNLTIELYQNWKENNWVNLSRELLYYQIINITSELTTCDHLFTLFPNPANSHFFIDLHPNNIQQADIQIYNDNGQKIYSHIIQNSKNRTSLDLSGFAEGTYFVNINDGYKQETQTFLIVR